MVLLVKGLVTLFIQTQLFNYAGLSLQWNKLLSDSGNLIDKRYRGGRLGMYVFSQKKVRYSALVARSPEVATSYLN